MISFQSFVQEGVFDPGIFKAIFLAGGPGSGKSYVAGKTTGGLGLKLINSDETLERLLKKSIQSLICHIVQLFLFIIQKKL